MEPYRGSENERRGRRLKKKKRLTGRLGKGRNKTSPTPINPKKRGEKKRRK